jgi:hypothetical protein
MIAAARHVRRGLIAVLLLSTACLSSTGGGGGGGGGANALTAAQLRAAAQSPDDTLYQMISRLKPEWLVAPTGQPEPTVFVDGVQTGSVSSLQVISALAVESVRFLGAQAAGARYSGVRGAVIDVTLAT